MWPFTRKTSRVDSILELMKTRPTEWEFGSREYNGDYYQIISHKKSDVSLRLKFRWSDDTTPTAIRFWHRGSQPHISGQEKQLLIDAIHQLQFDRVNELATNYLNKQNPIKCKSCKKRIQGWAWICKCQTALDQGCYEDSNICPSCGGTMLLSLDKRS